MVHVHPLNDKACVRYYYLPERNGNGAEIIEVLNSKRFVVDVPMWEEDVMLEPFHTRPMTSREAQICKGAEIWKLFISWDKLFTDHLKYGVQKTELTRLEDCQKKLCMLNSTLA